MSKSNEEIARNSAPPSDTINVAVIGVGVMGGIDTRSASKAGARIAALCDVDETRLARYRKEFPGAALYKDYRLLLEKEKGIDGFIVATPNHTHAMISIAAMELGKHVYCEKPLAHTIYELRKMKEAAREYKVAAQLGNQGRSYESHREFCECIWSGAIGEVREAHVVVDGFDFSAIDELPTFGDDHAVPESLDWDLWLGPAPCRKYNPRFHPLMWRCLRPFSTGVIGDFICHVVDPVFAALDLGVPTSIVAEAEGYDPEEHGDTFPQSSKIQFEFPARGERPPVTMYWYDGERYTFPRPEELNDGEAVIPSGARGGPPVGGLVVGDKGKIVYGSHGAAEWRIIPEAKMNEYMGDRAKVPDPRGTRMPDNLAHHRDWLRACKGWDSVNSPFDGGAELTEIAILGSIAQRMMGTELQWDPEYATFPNHPNANQYLHYPYRDGWTL